MGSDSKNNGGSGGGGAQIPGTAKGIVHSLREMVNKNCTDTEIYAVLKDCAMDPNEAAQRLLSQDTFHEVKSKRERRKEMKETQESKARSNGTSIWGCRVGSEHGVGRSGSTNSSSNELGKAPYQKENGSVASSLYSYASVSRTSTKTLNDQASSYSDCLNADNGRQSVGTGDHTSSLMPPSPGLQPTWLAANSGHVSMADIVRMGRPYNKASQVSTDSSQDVHPTHQSGVPEVTLDEFDNEWPMIEQITVATPTPALDTSAAVSDAKYYNESQIHGDIANLPRHLQLDEAIVSKSNFSGENLGNDFTVSASASSRHLLVSGIEGASNGDGKLLNDKSSSDSHEHMHEHQEGDSASFTDDVSVAVSSATASLQQLSIEKDEPVVPPAEDKRAVVLPNYLQTLTADCSHLSFGTYRSGNGSAPYSLPGCNTVRNDLEETSAGTDSPPAAHLESRHESIGIVLVNVHLVSFVSLYIVFFPCRSLGCRGNNDVGDIYDLHKKAPDARNHGLPVAVLTEFPTQNIPETTSSQEHIPSSSVTDSSLRNIQQSSRPSTFLTDPHARNISYLPNEVRPYSNSIPFDLLATTVQSLRSRDSTSFLSAQPMPSRYGSTLSSMNNQPMSVSEGSGVFSLAQPSTQVLPGGNMATGPVLPQYLPTNSYSEVVTPAMPQSYAYMPPTQQVYADSSAIHESLAGMKYNLSTHRGDASIHSLPHSISTSGYGNFGSSTNIPGSFLHNLLNAPGSAYDGVLRAQYKDGHNPILRQNDSSATWNYGPSSRTMPAVPDGGYYNILGQNQQHAGYRQNQQPPQQYGGLGYPNIYNAELRSTREQQRQSLSDLSLSGSQGPSSKQSSNQIWRPSY